MALIIEYGLRKGFSPTKETFRACEESRKAMQNILVETSKIVYPKATWLTWLLSRFYKKVVSNRKISYNFYLFPSGDKYEKFVSTVKK